MPPPEAPSATVAMSAAWEALTDRLTMRRCVPPLPLRPLLLRLSAAAASWSARVVGRSPRSLSSSSHSRTSSAALGSCCTRAQDLWQGRQRFGEGGSFRVNLVGWLLIVTQTGAVRADLPLKASRTPCCTRKRRMRSKARVDARSSSFRGAAEVWKSAPCDGAAQVQEERKCGQRAAETAAFPTGHRLGTLPWRARGSPSAGDLAWVHRRVP